MFFQDTRGTQEHVASNDASCAFGAHRAYTGRILLGSEGLHQVRVFHIIQRTGNAYHNAAIILRTCPSPCSRAGASSRLRPPCLTVTVPIKHRTASSPRLITINLFRLHEEKSTAATRGDTCYTHITFVICLKNHHSSTYLGVLIIFFRLCTAEIPTILSTKQLTLNSRFHSLDSQATGSLLYPPTLSRTTSRSSSLYPPILPMNNACIPFEHAATQQQRGRRRLAQGELCSSVRSRLRIQDVMLRAERK